MITETKDALTAKHILHVFDRAEIEKNESIVFALDTSGAFSLFNVFRVLAEAFEARQLRRIIVMQFDNSIVDIGTFTAENIETLRSMRFRGGGGTLLSPVLNVARHLNYGGSYGPLVKLIVFSDCFFADMDMELVPPSFRGLETTFVSWGAWPYAPVPCGHPHMILDPDKAY